MRVPHAFLSLPPSLLLLLATQLLHAQADASNQNEESQALPTAVRKMSLDEGEKFMPEYYAFAPAGPFRDNPQIPLGLWAREADVPVLTPDEEALLAINSSAALAFRPPFPRHYDDRGLDSDSESSKGWQREISLDEEKRRGRNKRGEKNEEAWSLYRRTVKALTHLESRQFMCPGGTHACSDIGEPDYCCTDGTTCFVVEDAPDAGNVGCCPDGQTCGGSVASCADGNTACPAEEGGGCCIPGFVCASVGCVKSTYSTIPSTTPTPTPTQAPTSTSVITTTTTATPTTTSTTANGTGLPPVRPTSSSPNTSNPITTTTTTSSEYCPTGFYACVASAGSGCCRTGRDCSTTSCPAPAPSTTIINAHGATVVVPLSDAQAATSGSGAVSSPTCASGWFLCGADAGPVAGCCPSGYACGTASCSLVDATASATDTVQKGRPGAESAASVMRGRGAAGSLGMVVVVVVVVGVGLLFF